MEVTSSSSSRLSYPGIVEADGALQILLVSPSQKYLEELQKSLYTTRSSQEQKRNYSINVHICKSITDATDLSPENFKVDYVVFLVNLVNYNCLEELECHLKFLKPYFRREKICLVNPNPSYVDSVIQPEVLWEFAKFHQLNLLNGKVMDESKIIHLSKRILNLAEASCGITNGIPLTGLV